MAAILRSAKLARTTDGSIVIPFDLVWPLSVVQYHKMIREGILTEDDPVELIEGVLVAKMPKNPPHSVATGTVREALEKLLPAGWHVRVQEPITTEVSE